MTIDGKLVGRYRVDCSKFVKAREKKAGLAKVQYLRHGRLFVLLAENPYQTPPPYEKLLGDLAGAYSRRINIQHRLVYQVEESQRVVKVIRMWTHYE